MLKGKRKTQNPCPVCYLHLDRCICALIPRWDLTTRLCLVIHAKELKRTTNTGRLALECLQNSEMRVRGKDKVPSNLSDLINSNYHPLFLYPSENAVELNSQFVSALKKPVLLIVPDGNWRQASKVHYRHHELSGVQRVHLKPSVQPSQGFLRHETVPNGMATLEAIAEAMHILEGAEVGLSLKAVYHAKLRQTLLGRGSPAV